MSVDVCLVCEAGGAEPAVIVGTDHNYTSNTTSMWMESGVDFDKLDGMPGSAVAPVIRAGIEKMRSDPVLYSAMAPANGWGDYAGTVEFLSAIASHCERYPLAKLLVQ